MIRLLVLLGILAAAGITAEWLADLPGPLRVEWQGWEVQAAPGLMMTALLLLAALLVIGIGIFRFVWTLPRRMAAFWRAQRLRRGWNSLESGLVAAAGGDERGVRGALKGIQVLPPDAPLRLLLEAQAAMLTADPDSAHAVLERMEHGTHTRLAALRGLVAEVRQQGRLAQALDLAEQAARWSPSPRWALQACLDLSLQLRRWAPARRAVDSMRRHGYLDEKAANRIRGLIATEVARACHADRDPVKARRAASEALSFIPGFVPAAAMAAEVSLDAGRTAEAARVIRQAWNTQPHPDLALLWLRASSTPDRLAGIGPLEELIGQTPDTIEGHLALAEVAMGGKLYGVARKHLDLARENHPDERVYRMLADLERTSGNDPAAATRWLAEALEAKPAPSWLCRTCAERCSGWQAVCERCGSFDTIEWGSEQDRKRKTRRSGMALIPHLPPPDTAATAGATP